MSQSRRASRRAARSAEGPAEEDRAVEADKENKEANDVICEIIGEVHKYNLTKKVQMANHEIC